MLHIQTSIMKLIHVYAVFLLLTVPHVSAKFKMLVYDITPSSSAIGLSSPPPIVTTFSPVDLQVRSIVTEPEAAAAGEVTTSVSMMSDTQAVIASLPHHCVIIASCRARHLLATQAHAPTMMTQR